MCLKILNIYIYIKKVLRHGITYILNFHILCQFLIILGSRRKNKYLCITFRIWIFPVLFLGFITDFQILILNILFSFFDFIFGLKYNFPLFSVLNIILYFSISFLEIKTSGFVLDFKYRFLVLRSYF